MQNDTSLLVSKIQIRYLALKFTAANFFKALSHGRTSQFSIHLVHVLFQFRFWFSTFLSFSCKTEIN